MDDKFENLGVRIIQAARMAVAVHLHQGVELTSNRSQRVVIGRSGPRVAVHAFPASDYYKGGSDSSFATDGAGR
jgi:hypothetical protein